MSMRLALTTPRYPPLLGGTETHVYEVGRRLAASGHDVTVLTTDPHGTLPVSEVHEGVTVRRFAARPRNGDLCWSPDLLAAVGSGGFDLVHVQGAHTLLAPTVLRAARGAGVPAVVTFHTGGHSSRLRSSLRSVQWRALRRGLRGAAALVAVSEHEVGIFARAAAIDPARIHVIRNGCDPLPVAGTPPLFSGQPLIVAVGRLERYKGHHRLIAAMAELLPRRPEAHLVLVGRGTYEDQLRKQAERLGVGPAVSFTSFDHQARDGLGALVSAAHVVALLSDYEAHPVAVLEALALGRRVLVADAPGLSELAPYELVTVVDPAWGPGALAHALEETAEAPAAPAPALPTWDDTTSALGRLYDDVLRSGRTSPGLATGASP